MRKVWHALAATAVLLAGAGCDRDSDTETEASSRAAPASAAAPKPTSAPVPPSLQPAVLDPLQSIAAPQASPSTPLFPIDPAIVAVIPVAPEVIGPVAIDGALAVTPAEITLALPLPEVREHDAIVALDVVVEPLRANGQFCTQASECASNYCYDGPGAENLCIAAEKNSAKPNEDGVMFGERYDFGDASFECQTEKGLSVSTSMARSAQRPASARAPTNHTRAASSDRHLLRRDLYRPSSRR